MSTLIINAYIPGADKHVSRVLFNDERILSVGGEELKEAEAVIDAEGMTLLPGAIDAHVHFREPGLTHKADIATESRAALAGGVTSFFDMPNTVPQTTSLEPWRQKMDIASKSSVANYAFFIGATNDNLEEILRADFSRIPGVKVFLGSSTGNMLVNNTSVLERLFEEVRVPIVVHAEDEETIAQARKTAEVKYQGNPPVCEHTNIRPVEACVAATTHAIDMLRRHPEAHLHIAHVSTADELRLIRQAKQEGLNLTCEVSPHHLLFTSEDYERLGARIKMNPSVKSPGHRVALREAVLDGTIDIVATDHAPHTLEEKEGDAFTAVSGAPMVQFSLPAMLDLFDTETVCRTMAENPARIFGLERRGRIAPDYHPEMVLVKRDMNGYIVADVDVVSKCGWTPLVGIKLYHKVIRTILPKPSYLTFKH